jgi:hypothetical protein
LPRIVRETCEDVMTVPSATAKSGPYNGNGVTTVFAYGFRILDAAHIRVIRTENDIDTEVTTGFTVSGVGNVGGGNVTFDAAPGPTQRITLIRNAPFTQQVDLENQGAYYAETIEEAFDLAAMRDQQLAEQIGRALVIPIGSPISGTQEAIDTLLAFGAIYLGASATAPVERADGSPLTGGELYFDTNAGSLSVYTGTAWNPLTATVNGTLARQTYTATAGQTVFAINYDVGFVDVWLNGMKLVAGDDFTATNGTSITLTSGAGLGDTVDIIAFGTFSLSSALNKNENLADLQNQAQARANLGFQNGGVFASTPEIRGLTGTGKLPTTEGIATAAALTAPSGDANWTPDWSGFISAEWVVTGNRTLQNPTNVIPGTSRVVVIQASTSTQRTISFGSNFAGNLPSSPVTSTARLLLTLYAVSASLIVVSAVEF